MDTIKKIFLKILSSVKVTILVAAIITMWVLDYRAKSGDIATLH